MTAGAIGWLALALIGQVATLLLVEAGPEARYQHFAFGGDLIQGARPVLLGILGVQMILVIALGRRHARALRAWIAGHRGWWRWVLLALLFVGTSAAPSRSLAQYGLETALATCIQALGLLTVLLFAASLEASHRRKLGARFNRLLDADGGSSIDRLTMCVATWVAVAAAGLGYFSYQWFPHIPDEVAYLLQSRYMAKGWLSAPLLPVQAAFTPEMVLVGDGGWFSIFPPGWPTLLSVGALVGLPGLVNPLLAAACVLLTRLLVQETHGRRTARLTVLLLGVSPWFVFMAMSFMSHIASTLFALLGAWAVARTRRGRAGFALLAGATVGAVSLIRPLEGVIVGLVLGLWLVWPGDRRRWVLRPILFVLAATSMGVLNFPYNRHVTGDPLVFPIIAYTDQHYGPGTNALGFGANRGFGWTGLDPLPGHGPADVVINTALNGFALNIELFGWISGSLLLLGIFLLFGRPLRRDLGYLAAVLCVVGIQSLYWFSGGPDFGPRYWYLILIPCLLLTARGIEWLVSESRDGGLVPAAVGALMLCAVVSFFPWRAIDKYHGYRGMSPSLERLAEQNDFDGDLVFIRGTLHPDFNGAALLNPIDGNLEGTLYAWEGVPGARAALEAAFPGRRTWVIEGPSSTGGGYRVVERPSGAGDHP